MIETPYKLRVHVHLSTAQRPFASQTKSNAAMPKVYRKYRLASRRIKHAPLEALHGNRLGPLAHEILDLRCPAGNNVLDLHARQRARPARALAAPPSPLPSGLRPMPSTTAEVMVCARDPAGVTPGLPVVMAAAAPRRWMTSRYGAGR